MERQARQEWVAHLKNMRDWNALPAVKNRGSGALRFSSLEDFDSAHDDYDALLDTDYDHVFRHQLVTRPAALTSGDGVVGGSSSRRRGRTHTSSSCAASSDHRPTDSDTTQKGSIEQREQLLVERETSPQRQQRDEENDSQETVPSVFANRDEDTAAVSQVESGEIENQVVAMEASVLDVDDDVNSIVAEQNEATIVLTPDQTGLLEEVAESEDGVVELQHQLAGGGLDIESGSEVAF